MTKLIFVITSDGRAGIIEPGSKVYVKLGPDGPFAQFFARNLRLAEKEEILELTGAMPTRRVVRTAVKIRKTRADKGKKRDQSGH